MPAISSKAVCFHSSTQTLTIPKTSVIPILPSPFTSKGFKYCGRTNLDFVVIKDVCVLDVAGEDVEEVELEEDDELDEVLEELGDDVGVGVGVAEVRLVAKYDAFVTSKLHNPAETVQVAGETIPSLVQPEVELVERTTLRVWPFNESPTKMLKLMGLLNSSVTPDIPHCSAPSTVRF